MPFSIRTDLAMEARELHPSLPGVTEETEEREGVSISRITLTTDDAAKRLEKRRGRYVTLDAPELTDRPLDLFERVSRTLADELTHLMEGLGACENVLVVGLGNRAITPDSLGPRVVESVYVTRHIKQYLPDALPGPVRAVSAVAPGVLGVTGVETMEIVRGVVEHCRPDLVIAVDSLASRRAARISTTVQLTDTGISPGAGVGNNRTGLDRETLGVPVIAIGVPLVVFATTISQDTISLIADETGLHNDEERLKELAAKVIAEHIGELIVTPKEIDSIVADMTRIVADGINMALFGADYGEVRMLVA
jgi:GPR endopeptidase